MSDTFEDITRTSPAERLVMALLVKDYTTREAAQILGIAWGTAKNHICSAKQHAGVRTRDRLIALYVAEYGLD